MVPGKGLARMDGVVERSKFLLIGDAPPVSDLLPLCLLVGLSRPQTCRKIIEQAASLGVAGNNFFPSGQGRALLWGKFTYGIRNGDIC